jgi:RNA polymerase sigma-32 factor
MQAIEEGDLLPEQAAEIARRLNVSEVEVINMNRRLGSPDQSLNAPLRDEGEGEWQDWLVEDSDDQETVIGEEQETEQRRRLLTRAMRVLSDRERNILVERKLAESPATLQHLSQRYGISRERVRQIEVRAFQKLRKSVKGSAAERPCAC